MQIAGYPEDTTLRGNGRHPILEKETFEKLHRNEVIETRPHILHFGGFQVHKEHTQLLRIVNISPSSLRVSILGPETQWFKINFDKKGLLAPGMSEDIMVTFEPHEWRYHSDTIKIFCGELAENLVVPIHGYPSANDIVLPRILDFGSVAIGTSQSKVIPLSCKIPIQFEFEITVVEAHPDLTITPLSGIIPADGSSEIVATFAPMKHRTARAELQFHVAQFNSEPALVTVLGSCFPESAKLQVFKEEMAERSVVAAQKKQEEKAATLSKLKGRKKGPLQVIHPTFKVDELERTINGIKVPTTRADQHSTNFILNQTAGKLPLKDLAAFIREQREAADCRRQQISDGGQLEEEVVEEDKQAQELRFELHYREVDKKDKDKELKSNRASGEGPPDENAIAEVEAARRRRYDNIFQLRINDDLKRVESVLTNSNIAVPANFKPARKPEWDECANDIFSVRLQVIERFVRAGSKVLMRVRAQQRCSMLWEAIAEAGVVDRKGCQAWVEAENKAAASGTLVKAEKVQQKSEVKGTDDETDGDLLAVHIPKDFVLPLQTPTRTLGFSAEERQRVEVDHWDNFEEFLPHDPPAPLDHKVLNYPLHDVPPPSAYMKPNLERSRLTAALEEHLICGECGDALDGAELPVDMPDSCLLPPAHDALSLLIPSTDCRTYVAFPESAECDPEHRLAEKPTLLDPLRAVPLLPPDIMSLEIPWLESWRAPRQIKDPFQYSDAFEANFVEAGTALGPLLGSDLGGQRLFFMPAGGHERDLPSDTDDDEQPEFNIPAPGPEMKDKAISSLEGPVSSEMWYKRNVAEERLQELCASSSRAVRDRLTNLNSEMTGYKLYLG